MIYIDISRQLCWISYGFVFCCINLMRYLHISVLCPMHFEVVCSLLLFLTGMPFYHFISNFLMFCCMATEQFRFSQKYPWSFSILTNFLDLKYCLHHLDNLHVFKSEWIQYCRRWDGGLHTDSLI